MTEAPNERIKEELWYNYFLEHLSNNGLIDEEKKEEMLKLISTNQQ